MNNKSQKIEEQETILKTMGDGYKICGNCVKIYPVDKFKDKHKDEKTSTCDICRKKYQDRKEKYKCPHGKYNKSACKNCKGNSICIHGITKTYCKECGGGSLCKHGKRKDRCKNTECFALYKARQYCEHGSFKTSCVDCGGGGICEHKVRRVRCKICNLPGHLADTIRGGVNKTLKNGKKTQKSIKYLGCTLEEYKNYIENQFSPGMTWENHGTVWDVDHIIPLQYKNPSVEVTTQRLNFKNTQPLWKRNNYAKRNRYVSWLQQETLPGNVYLILQDELETVNWEEIKNNTNPNVFYMLEDTQGNLLYPLSTIKHLKNSQGSVLSPSQKEYMEIILSGDTPQLRESPKA